MRGIDPSLLPSAIVVEFKLHPSSGAHITVITASGTGQTSENIVCVK